MDVAPKGEPTVPASRFKAAMGVARITLDDVLSVLYPPDDPRRHCRLREHHALQEPLQRMKDAQERAGQKQAQRA